MGALASHAGGLLGLQVVSHVLLMIVCLLYLVHIVLDKVAPPSSGWQVPREWTHAGRPRFSFAFGALMGIGFVTIVRSWAPYILIAGCMVLADVRTGIFVFGMFGACRALPMMIVGVIYTASDFNGQAVRAGVFLKPLFIGAGHIKFLQIVTVFSMLVSLIVRSLSLRV